ncbi:MAG TPA: di-heme oxidoredictase family protein [Myxococcaceae bacterium]|nr:di-heme oxidoredictase family protein [Myxococcaceae bacterium]
MNVVDTSRRVALALVLGSAGCGTGSVGPMPAEPEADGDLTSASTGLRVPLQARPGEPLPGLTEAELARFASGKEEFEEEETPEDGLGPVFNDTSCARCHSDPAVGGSSALVETRFGAVGQDGKFTSLPEHGGSLIQVRGIGVAGGCDFSGELVPAQATLVSGRRTTPLFGLGLVDAVPESTFRYIAQIERALWPHEAGRVAVVHDIARNRAAVGRFGWKNQVPTLHQFSGDAYLNEMGITSPEFPDENCPGGDCRLLSCNPFPGLNDEGDGVVAFADFMTLLAPPPRKAISAQAWSGKRVFNGLGCSHCHWDTFRTGDSPVASLDKVVFHPYSDFLLHDMGSLGDGIEVGDARGREFRTAPLWGLSAFSALLHDGRAATVSDAILAHDGQARRARDRFAAASAEDRAALLAFLGTL